MSRQRSYTVLAKHFPDHPTQVAEYIAEAEHQDGYGYWRQFTTPGELVEDFQMYLEYLNDQGATDEDPG